MDKKDLPINCNYYIDSDAEFVVDLSQIMTIGKMSDGDYRVRFRCMGGQDGYVNYGSPRGKKIFDAFMLWIDMQTQYPSYK